MPLIFISDEGTYSIYRDTRPAYSWDAIVNIAHGPGFRRVVDAGDLDLAELWAEIRYQYGYGYQAPRAFRAHVRTLLTDPDDADAILFCASCNDPSWGLDETVRGLGAVCDSCADSYPECAHCNERTQYETTIHGESVCDSCRDEYFTYCEHCDEYVDPDEDHNHDCCESPAMAFRIRNDGHGMLDNDTRITVSLPAGIISDEGISGIISLIHAERRNNADTEQAIWYAYYDVTSKVHSLGNAWQTRDGNYTKRLSRMAYKLGVRLSPETISAIGNVARDHSRGVDYAIEVTRDLNLPAAEFAHSGSCYWGGYSESRCALKTNGGFGLRSFNTCGVSGRAWVVPLQWNEDGDTLTPTFNAETPIAFVVFNGYGDLSGYAPARIMAHLAGMTYRKVSFDWSLGYNGSVYVNAGGYLVAPEDVASAFTDGSLHLNTPQHSELYSIESGVTSYV